MLGNDMGVVLMLLAKKDEIDQLIQIIDSQNANYLTIIGLTIALFGIIFGIVQWRLSTQQIKRIKMEAQEGIRKEYHLDGMLKDISDFEDNLSELKSNFEKDKFERETSLETIIFEKIDLFTTVSSDSARANISKLNELFGRV